MYLLAEGLVAEKILYNVLAVVKGALDGNVVDVWLGDGGHLFGRGG